MFDRQKLGAIARKLGAAVAEMRWIAWTVAGFCVACYPTTRDPIELVLAITTLVLAYAGAWLHKTIRRRMRIRPRRMAKAANAEDEGVPTQA